VYGGPQNFGFPDSTYFMRVTQELASKGVVRNLMQRQPEELVEDFLGIKLS